MGKVDYFEIITEFLFEISPVMHSVINSTIEVCNEMLEEVQYQHKAFSWDHVTIVSYQERILAFEHSVKTLISLTDMYGNVGDRLDKILLEGYLKKEIEYLSNMIEDFRCCLGYSFVDTSCKNVQNDIRKLLNNVQSLVNKIEVE